MLYLNVGEWSDANIFFGAVFVVAGLMVFGLGWWVVRGDRLNRAQVAEPREELLETVTATQHEVDQEAERARTTS